MLVLVQTAFASSLAGERPLRTCWAVGVFVDVVSASQQASPSTELLIDTVKLLEVAFPAFGITVQIGEICAGTAVFTTEYRELVIPRVAFRSALRLVSAVPVITA
jgi:hypothetical protein